MNDFQVKKRAEPTVLARGVPSKSGAEYEINVCPTEATEIRGEVFSCLMPATVVTIFPTNLQKAARQYWGAIDCVERQVVKVQLNGELREVPEGLTLAALLEWLDLPRDRVAVERNLEIVPRTGWEVTRIQPGDRLEVVQLVGGGLE